MSRRNKVPKMLVSSAPHAMVLDIDHMAATGRRRYIGRATETAWTLDELSDECPAHIQTNSFLEPGEKPIPHSAYPLAKPELVPVTTYYIKALSKGDLLPADNVAALLVGVTPKITRKKDGNG